jgi:hypothetical protein
MLECCDMEIDEDNYSCCMCCYCGEY